ncbi:unannotated protein [freshwater metagenome]|uniref:Unannotated protein n=1 Tax=freshwater metagenome TaxID=449393 RepID=A0A6J7XWF2_9ZZZZ|nr:polyprenyl synthetase family protein [Actinomycetota bacterium]
MSEETLATLSRVREQVKSELSAFLETQAQYLEGIGSELGPVSKALSEYLLDGGKRLRPLFAYSGFIGAGASPTPEYIRAFASLELLQGCALIHDDLMDGSDTRRGKPAIHRLFESMHLRDGGSSSAQQFGQAAAILLGDLALVYSDRMLHESGVPTASLISSFSIHDEMRVELMAGQYLDVYEQTRGTHTVARALTIARYKSGKYTIERPLHFGAALAITDAAQRARLHTHFSDYGLPLGEAFQLRDDLLGVFGNPELTGKPAGDDLREGKRTVLMAMTQERITADANRQLELLFGDPQLTLDGVQTLRTIISESGAPTELENMIEDLTHTALGALEHEEINHEAREILTTLANLATKRAL